MEGTSFQFGIEEEYFVCDAGTLQPAMNTPQSLFDRRHPRIGTSLNREMLQAQIEVPRGRTSGPRMLVMNLWSFATWHSMLRVNTVWRSLLLALIRRRIGANLFPAPNSVTTS